MGVWSRMTGSLKIHKSKNVSIEKLFAEEVTDEFSIEVNRSDAGDSWEYEIDIVFSGDFDDTKNSLDEFFNKLKSNRETLDLDLTTRVMK